ncbi:hypothetical protein Pcinc_016902 [Petrolisthes cinctipes]|uniref:Sulfatase N-terminal domain-containing protein n=1 Tax=Petrolisthes cinctipes TaxID=88211 RepID=A0AAE1KQI3_PETCI|nr:hypothetical protein Pcinc_021870 [Petrolisthes cinctipes]KAK3878485.1 hypothetical protein Pcinc_016902 [Petrolisthes cinctipes]
MEIQQIVYLILGCALFLYVIYFSTPYQNHNDYQEYNNTPQSPNIVFILTDDQDAVLGGMKPMIHTQQLLAAHGLTLTNAFVASPLCCPSRSSILTGQYVHNHGAINNSLSGQCSSQRWQDGPEKKTFAAHLHGAGYTTFFAGKYLNQYGEKSAGGLSHVPPGWDWWVGLKGNSRYYNYTLSINGTRETHKDDPSEDYLTDVIRRRALEFLEKRPQTKPFFMMLSTPACHAPFTPAPRYAHNFSSDAAPRTDNFNVVAGPRKHWLLRQGVQPLPTDVLNKVDDVYRNRLRTLLSVDQLVYEVVKSLEVQNLLDNTYIVFTSDNGYHLGQFSQPLDKREPYETDVRVPFLVRGPGVPKGKTIAYPTTNIDLAPTFLEVAGIPVPKYMDGMSLKHIIMDDEEKREDQFRNMVSGHQQVRRTMLVEHSGEGRDTNPGCPSVPSPGMSGCNPDFACKCEDSSNNTYACLRQLGSRENRLYCQWLDSENFEELYDLAVDPWELNNTVSTLGSNAHKKLRHLLKNLQRCRGSRCRTLAGFVL